MEQMSKQTRDGADGKALGRLIVNAASATILQNLIPMRDRTAASADAFVERLQLAWDLKLRPQTETMQARSASTNYPPEGEVAGVARCHPETHPQGDPASVMLPS